MFPDWLSYVTIMGTGIMACAVGVVFAQGARRVTVVGLIEATLKTCAATVRRDLAALSEAALLAREDSPEVVACARLLHGLRSSSRPPAAGPRPSWQ